jgi:Aldehyde dehydrogenase family
MNAALLGGIDNSDEIAQEELFGPVGVLLPYRTVEEAIAIAHDSPYGLHAAVYGAPVEAYEEAKRLRAGPSRSTAPQTHFILECLPGTGNPPQDANQPRCFPHRGKLSHLPSGQRG